MDAVSERGFTLVEAAMALLILAVVLVGVLPAFTMLLNANTRSEVRSEAVGATQIVLEGLRLSDPSTMPNEGADDPVYHTIGDRDFEVITRYCIRPEYCGPTSRHLLVEVFLDNRKVYDVETVFTKLQ